MKEQSRELGKDLLVLGIQRNIIVCIKSRLPRLDRIQTVRDPRK